MRRLHRAARAEGGALHESGFQNRDWATTRGFYLPEAAGARPVAVSERSARGDFRLCLLDRSPARKGLR